MDHPQAELSSRNLAGPTKPKHAGKHSIENSIVARVGRRAGGRQIPRLRVPPFEAVGPQRSGPIQGGDGGLVEWAGIYTSGLGFRGSVQPRTVAFGLHKSAGITSLAIAF